jgi:DNA-binding MarR family transcriptional regulator
MRQLHVLRTIQDLGPMATLAEVAKQVERAPHAISKQSVRMENDGLIKRVKNTPKSNLLNLELTEKGLEVAKLARQSEVIDSIFSVLPKEERQQLILMLQEITTKAKTF